MKTMERRWILIVLVTLLLVFAPVLGPMFMVLAVVVLAVGFATFIIRVQLEADEEAENLAAETEAKWLEYRMLQEENRERRERLQSELEDGEYGPRVRATVEEYQENEDTRHAGVNFTEGATVRADYNETYGTINKGRSRPVRRGKHHYE